MTSLLGETMPYIRYWPGDHGVLDRTACPCGSPFPRLRSIEGRRSRVIRLPGGRKASVRAVMATALRPFATLRQFRLLQEALDRFILLTVFLEPPAAELLSAMEQRVIECIGADVRVEVVVVDSLDEEGVRKFGQFVSKLPRNPDR